MQYLIRYIDDNDKTIYAEVDKDILLLPKDAWVTHNGLGRQIYMIEYFVDENKVIIQLKD